MGKEWPRHGLWPYRRHKQTATLGNGFHLYAFYLFTYSPGIRKADEARQAIHRRLAGAVFVFRFVVPSTLIAMRMETIENGKDTLDKTNGQKCSMPTAPASSPAAQ